MSGGVSLPFPAASLKAGYPFDGFCDRPAGLHVPPGHDIAVLPATWSHAIGRRPEDLQVSLPTFALAVSRGLVCYEQGTHAGPKGTNLVGLMSTPTLALAVLDGTPPSRSFAVAVNADHGESKIQ